MFEPQPPSLKEVIKKFQLSTKQSLGQNFILDQQLTDKIVRKANLFGNINAIEIGPGPGGLTRSILSSDKVISYYGIEVDQRCYPLLEELFPFYNQPCELIKEDALKVDLHLLGDAPRAVLANLPYNVSTVILIKLLKNITEFESLTLMFQKEVATRILSDKGSKEYGRLSVMAQWVCDIELCFDIPPQAFVPAPKVVSTVVKFVPKKDMKLDFLKANWEHMEKVVAAAFQQRRKMLRQSLKTIFGSDVGMKLENIGIDPTLRAENLSVNAFFQISKML